MAAEGDDDYDDTPLQHLRPFGSGLHRKKIAFVPASGDSKLNSTDPSLPAANPNHDVADLYLSMVLPADAKPDPLGTNSEIQTETTLCEVCRLPLTPLASDDTPPSETSTPHVNSLAHQLCLPHSHPPSALDRSRMGVSYLSSHGWDPDSRRGLGVDEQGVQFPVKTKVKRDNLGIGMVVPKNSPITEKEKLLDAGKVRKLAGEEKRKAERIRRMLSGDKDLEKYLGPGAS